VRIAVNYSLRPSTPFHSVDEKVERLIALCRSMDDWLSLSMCSIVLLSQCIQKIACTNDHDWRLGQTNKFQLQLLVAPQVEKSIQAWTSGCGDPKGTGALDVVQCLPRWGHFEICQPLGHEQR
jgi:hypothetical protein